MGNDINITGNNNKIEELKKVFEDAFFKSPNKEELYKKLGDLLNSKLNSYEIVNIFYPLLIRNIISKKQEFFELFVAYLIEYLFTFAQQKQNTENISNADLNLLKNVLRILSKIIAVLQEPNFQQINKKLLWDYIDPDYSIQEQQQQQGPNKIVIYKSDQQDINKDRENHIPLGIKFLTALMSLCFFPNFTISKTEQKQQGQSQNQQNNNEEKTPQPQSTANNISSDEESANLGQTLWCNIMGLSESLKGQINHKNEFFENRLLILYCIISMMGSTLFIPNHASEYLNPTILFITSPKNPYSKKFIYSLIYFILGYKNEGILPFQGKVNIKEDFGPQLAEKCSQILLCLLNTNIDQKLLQKNINVSIELTQVFDHLFDSEENPNSMSQSMTFSRNFSDMKLVFQNQAQSIIQKFEQPHSLLTFLDCILRHLERPIKSQNSVFPNKHKKVNNSEELIGILYKSLVLNENLSKSLAASGHFSRILQILLWYAVKSSQKQILNIGDNQNIFLLVLGILTMFTSNQNFSVCIGKPLDFSLSFDILPIISGTYGDLLIITIATLIFKAHDNFDNTFAYNWLSILQNVSPFLRNLSDFTAVKLSQLLNFFTHYHIILETEFNPQALIKLITIFNNIITYSSITNSEVLLELYKNSQYILRIYKLSINEKNIDYVFSVIKPRLYKQANFLKDKKPLIDNQPQSELEKKQQEEYKQQEKTFYQNFKKQWKKYDWKSQVLRVNTQNILMFFKTVDEALKKENKDKTQVTLNFISNIIKSEDFVKSLKVPQNIIVEQFSNSGFMNYVENILTWQLFYYKTIDFPYFDYEEINFFKVYNQFRVQNTESINQQQYVNNQQQQQQIQNEQFPQFASQNEKNKQNIRSDGECVFKKQEEFNKKQEEMQNYYLKKSQESQPQHKLVLSQKSSQNNKEEIKNDDDDDDDDEDELENQEQVESIEEVVYLDDEEKEQQQNQIQNQNQKLQDNQENNQQENQQENEIENSQENT